MMLAINSLGREWLRVVKAALDSEGNEISPSVVKIDIAPDEDFDHDPLRRALDDLLDQCGHAATGTVASTIFPRFLWNPSADRSQLFERYLAILPRIRKHNPRGVYFERLINYPGKRNVKGFNQLDHIITTYTGGNHRRSALQASLVDPSTDLDTNAPVLGFPCLHQIGFLPNPRTKTLGVVAYYPMQYLLQRGYGNFLGLTMLGRFVGHELGFECDTVTCMAAVGKVESHTAAVRKFIQKF